MDGRAFRADPAEHRALDLPALEILSRGLEAPGSDLGALPTLGAGLAEVGGSSLRDTSTLQPPPLSLSISSDRGWRVALESTLQPSNPSPISAA